MNSRFVTILKENYRYFGGISFLYGLFFVFCLYENLSGITFPLCVIGTLFVYRLFMKKIGIPLKKSSKRYIIGMILLGFANCYTASSAFLFLDIVAVLLLFIVFMTEQFYEVKVWSLPLQIRNLFYAIETFLSKMFTPFTDGIRYLQKNYGSKRRKSKKEKAIVQGILISIPVLLVVVPLLFKSDRIFSNMFLCVFQMPNIEWIDLTTGIEKSLMFITGVICCYGFFRAMCDLNLKTEEKERKKVEPVIGITLNSILSVLYFTYSVVQIVYLFIGFEKGLPQGVSYSSYARSGFFELLVVSFINFVLVLVSNAVFEENKWLKILLFVISGCTFIMIGSSGYRMLLYIHVYHLTFLRVLVLWFLVVLTFFMIGLMVHINKRGCSLFRYMVIVLMCCYIPFVYSRPETFIASYNLSREYITWEDVYDVVYGGSYETIPALINLDPKQLNTWNGEVLYESVEVELERKVSSVLYDNKGKYQKAEDMDIREWNYSKYKAKKAAEQYFEKMR